MPKVKSDPFTIIGIMADEPFYFIAGQMHTEMELKFVRVNDFGFYDSANEKLSRNATYLYFDNENRLLYFFILNDIPFIKKLKTPNMLLFVFGRDCLGKTKELTKQIRRLLGIRYCQKYYSSHDEIQQEVDEEQMEQSQVVQLNVFGQTNSDVYRGVKEKRAKVIRRFRIDKTVIKDFQEDLFINLEEYLDSNDCN